MVRRFLVFAGYDYYPSGGWDDFKASFDTLEEAKRYAQELVKTYDWAEVVDLEVLEKVASFTKAYQASKKPSLFGMVERAKAIRSIVKPKPLMPPTAPTQKQLAIAKAIHEFAKSRKRGMANPGAVFALALLGLAAYLTFAR